MFKLASRTTSIPALVFAAALISACDSNNDRTPEPFDLGDPVAVRALEVPNVHVQFPPPVSATQDSSITVRGAVTDPSGVSAVQLRVNGADPGTVEGLETWSTSVTLEPGLNVIEVSYLDADGESTDVSELQITRTAQLASPVDMVVDAENSRLLVLDSSYRAILEVDTDTGERRWFEPEVPQDTLLTRPRSIALDRAMNRLLVSQVDEETPLVAIDLSTGEQTAVALPDIEDFDINPAIALTASASGMYFAAMENILLDADGERTSDREAATTVGTASLVYHIDAAATTATALSGYDIPDNEAFFYNILDLADGEGSNLLYVLDRATVRVSERQTAVIYSIKSVDKSTGARTRVFPLETPTENPDAVDESEEGEEVPIADADAAQDENTEEEEAPGPDQAYAFAAPRKIALNPEDNSLWILDANQFVRLDLMTNDAQVVSSNTVPEDNAWPLRAQFALTLDPVTGTVYGADNAFDHILSIHPQSGVRQLLSSSDTQPMATADGLLLDPYSLSLDPFAERLFIGDRLTANIMVLDMTSGSRARLVPDSTSDQARALFYPLASAYDAEGDRLFVLDNLNQRPGTSAGSSAPRIVEIDAESGETVVSILNSTSVRLPALVYSAPYQTLYMVRQFGSLQAAQTAYTRPYSAVYRLPLAGGGVSLSQLLSGPTHPDESNFLAGITAITADDERGRLLATDGVTKSLITIDLRTGEREILGAVRQEDGPNLNQPQAIQIDNSGERALILDSTQSQLIAVDLATGERSWAFDSPSTSRNLLVNPRNMVLHPAFNYAIVSDSGLATVYAIDLVTQERVILAR